MEKVRAGQFAQVHYTGKLTDGTIFDSSDGRQPLEFKVGDGQVIPGFDKAIEGMGLQEEKTFLLKFDDAYGPEREDLKQAFSREILGDKEVALGQELWFKSPQGPVPGKISALEAETVTVDFNHPLAGRDLEFSVKLVGISDAPTQVQGGCSCSSSSCDSGSCDSGCDSGTCGH
jgi:peptidylprolyl isomerase